jgi:hypothetical protein
LTHLFALIYEYQTINDDSHAVNRQHELCASAK